VAIPESSAPSTPPATAAQAQSRSGGNVDGDSDVPANSTLECDISPRALRAADVGTPEHQAGRPLYRPLRVYTQDPTVSRRDGAIATINVIYEDLKVGPAAARIEVVDEEPADIGDTPRMPLDLDEPFVMLQQGRAPSPTDPGFRAQNAYAICSTTYAAFRQALGRDLVWGFSRGPDPTRAAPLRVRTSFASQTNAYYDSETGQLRFGWFKADAEVEGRNVPFGRVYTALQHDVVVHEMSHALLDGLRSHLLTPTNVDVLAFHEGFADLVAIFQRFTYAAVVRAGIEASRGKLLETKVFTNIAQQFGETIGLRNALRSAVLGATLQHDDSKEPHERGTVLVAAVYEAFATVYERKISRTMRLASNGTGVFPEGRLPELLIDELTQEALSLASQFLSICIRAVDYCPPIDLTFGVYLRALVTADMDLVPDDKWQYREALIDAFRVHGIIPYDQENLAEETLRWRATTKSIPACASLSFARLRFRGDPATPASARELQPRRRQGRPAHRFVDPYRAARRTRWPDHVRPRRRSRAVSHRGGDCGCPRLSLLRWRHRHPRSQWSGALRHSEAHRRPQAPRGPGNLGGWRWTELVADRARKPVAARGASVRADPRQDPTAARRTADRAQQREGPAPLVAVLSVRSCSMTQHTKR
jgi:hypothetical protein